MQQQRSQLQRIEALTREMEYLQSRRDLFLSISIGTRQNIQAMAAKMLTKYHELFRHGYRPNAPESDAGRAKEYMLTIFEDDMKNRDFTGPHALLEQWERISRFHESVQVDVDSVRALATYFQDEHHEDEVYVVKSAGSVLFCINEWTIQKIFPTILHDTALVDSLLGQQYVISFTVVMHINARGRIFQMESNVDTTTALLNLVRSPATAVRMLESAAISREGHMCVPSNGQNNVIEHGFL